MICVVNVAVAACLLAASLGNCKRLDVHDVQNRTQLTVPGHVSLVALSSTSKSTSLRTSKQEPVLPEGDDEVVPHKDTKGKEWSYSSTESWSDNYEACAGASQSPINLGKASVTQRGTEKLSYRYTSLDGLKIHNTGHDIQVNGEFGHLLLPDGVYKVKEFHFHFPSEHEVDGKLASGEMHIVHQRVGATGTEGLAVVALLLEEKGLKGGWDRDAELNFLRILGFQSSEMPRKGGRLPAEGQSFEIDLPVDIGTSFVNQLNGPFFHYQGSLTTPPCSEGVHWYVLKDPAAVTSDMVRHFKELFPSPSNNRPVQGEPADRPIVESKMSVPGEYPIFRSFSRRSCSYGTWVLAAVSVFAAVASSVA